MIYLDYGATSFRKPPQVRAAVLDAMTRCANPGRGGYGAAMAAARVVYDAREQAAALFHCRAEQVVFTSNCTHGLNMAIRTLVSPGDRVVTSGFEHNAVTRCLHDLGAEILVAGRRLFDPADTLRQLEIMLERKPKAAVFTHVSNVFGYVLPIEAMCSLCREQGVPVIIDAAQSAGAIPVDMGQLGAAFIAMPGHKGLLGPQGTGLLLCARDLKPLLCGGTGSESIRQEMPEALPERGEAGTLNVPGIAGLGAGLRWLRRQGVEKIGAGEHRQMTRCAKGLESMGLRVFHGQSQSGTVSFLPNGDCEEFADVLGRLGIAVRAGLHCAPLAHESAGTLDTGTVRVSYGPDASDSQTDRLLGAVCQALRR